MPNQWVAQNSFIGGEWGQDVLVRSDLDLYENAAKDLTNYLVMPQGGVIARPGSLYFAEVKNSANTARLFPFSFNVEQSYIIEAGDIYFRFYTELGRLEVASVPVEVATPYLHTQLSAVHFTQSADTMYLAHASHPPQELQRTSATTFAIAAHDYINGPFQDYNGDTTKTMTISATTVGTGRTVNSTGHTPFTANHIGSIWAMGDRTGGPPKFQGYFKITAFASTSQVTVTVIKAISAVGPLDRWAAPAWSAETGWPSTVEFHDNRLIWGGAGATPQAFQASVIGVFNDHAQYINDVIADDAAIRRELAAQQVNQIRFLVSGESLFGGTAAGWWKIEGNNEATITPANVNAKKRGNKGTSVVYPVVADDTLVYLHKAGKRVYGIEFDIEQDTKIARELTAYNQQVTGTGLTQISYEDGDIPLIWGVRADGLMATCTYDLVQKILAWSKHTTQGLYKSVATIPRGSDEQEITFAVVERTITSGTVQYVEMFDEDTELDSAITTTLGAPATTVTGLGHLEGKTVGIKADGMNQVDKVVTSGQITGLDPAVTVVSVGLSFVPSIELLPPHYDTRSGGVSQGRILQTPRMVLDVVNVNGLHVNGTHIVTQKAKDPMSQPVPLFTGQLQVGREVKGKENPVITQPWPFRSQIRAIYRYVELEED